MKPVDPELPGAAPAPGDPPPPEAESRPQPVAKPRRRWWFWLLAIPVQLVLLVILTLVWVLGTETGLRTALSLADDLAPGLVQVEQVQGRIAGDLRLTGLQLRLPDLHLSAEDLHLRWRPWGALAGTLHIESLAARGLHIATADIGSAFMLVFMKKMHGVALKTARYRFTHSIT